MTVLTAIEQTVSRFRDKCAVDDGKQQYTYEGLWRRSGQVARHLASMGLPQRPMIAVACSGSAEVVAVILACWRAGGTLVPLDPEYPAARLAAVLADARPDIVIADDALTMPACHDLLTMTPSELGTAGDCPLPGPADLDASYLLYTSGSTGEPKGIVVSHAAIALVASDFASIRPGLSSSDVVLAHTTLSFDICFTELVAPLLAGATISVPPAALRRRPDELMAWIATHGVTFVQATPTSWQLLWLAGLDTAEGWTRVRGVSGGEALREAAARLLASRMLTFYNMYGPTENTIWSSCWRVPDAVTGPVLLGGPMPHVSFYPLDSQLRVAAAGSLAELYLGGDQLALGYWRDPRQTAQRFVPDPFASQPGARMYRSGDVVRVFADGGVEYLRRSDRQVKVRGQRIELGAIEAAVLSHPEVEQAAVVTASVADSQVIVGCVVASRPDVDPADIRRHAAALIPPGWLPNRLVVVDALPLTGSGKVDSGAVASCALRSASERQGREPSEPRTPTEQIVLEICHEILGDLPSEVGADFFASGGDSLQAIKLAADLSARYAIELPLGAVFEFPLLRDLAAEVDSVGRAAAAASDRRLA